MNVLINAKILQGLLNTSKYDGDINDDQRYADYLVGVSHAQMVLRDASRKADPAADMESMTRLGR